jgi:hypothetical protein
MIGRWRRRHRASLAQRLLADVHRAGDYMTMIRLLAEREGVPTLGAAVSNAIWRDWEETTVRPWAEGQG